MIKFLNPLELLGYSLATDISLPNRARPKHCINRNIDQHPSKLFLSYLLNPKIKRLNWLYTGNNRLRGIISVITLPGGRSWDIDCLGISETDVEKCYEVLEELSVKAISLRIERIFLRLEENCPFIEAARRNNFNKYVVEYLYRIDSTSTLPITDKTVLKLRQRKPDDDMALFNLYLSTIPSGIKQAEGLIISEWKHSAERGAPSYGKTLITLRDNEPVGWLRYFSNNEAKQFEFMAKSDVELEALYHYSLRFEKRNCQIFWVLPDFQRNVLLKMEKYSATEVNRYMKMVKHLTSAVKKPVLLPLNA